MMRPIDLDLHSPSAFTAGGTRQQTISRQLLILLRWEAVCCRINRGKEANSNSRVNSNISIVSIEQTSEADFHKNFLDKSDKPYSYSLELVNQVVRH